MLRCAGEGLGDDSRRAVYPELCKRLDDSSDANRIAACEALLVSGCLGLRDDGGPGAQGCAASGPALLTGGGSHASSAAGGRKVLLATMPTESA